MYKNPKVNFSSSNNSVVTNEKVQIAGWDFFNLKGAEKLVEFQGLVLDLCQDK